MDSLEKVDQLQRAFMESAPSPDASGLELGLRTLLMTAGPMLRQSLPEHAGDLDDLLERGARWMLEMRSDDAEPLELIYAAHLESVDHAGRLEDAAPAAADLENGSP